MQRNCQECGEKVIGRTDKKFCSDYCRNAYNNKINKDTTNLIRTVNNRLRRNYRILKELNPNEKTTATKSMLLAKGFDFEYFTNTYTTKTGTVYYFVYDQGYLPLESDYYALVKRS